MTVVSVLGTSPKSVLDDYCRVMNTAGFKINKKHKTILKINLSWMLFFPACSTPPRQLEGVLRCLKEHKYMMLSLWKIKRLLPILGRVLIIINGCPC